jgi:hypothetical protein
MLVSNSHIGAKINNKYNNNNNNNTGLKENLCKDVE